MERITLLQGDCREVLKTLPADYYHCGVTSPPYWGLRDYKIPPSVWGGDAECEHEWEDHKQYKDSPTRQGGEGVGFDDADTTRAQRWTTSAFCRLCGAWRGCLGNEPTPELYVERIVEAFREVRRVLREDGTLWLNLGDSMSSGHSAASCGTIDTALADSQARGCLYQNLCDECQAVLLAHRFHISPEHVRELADGEVDPSQVHNLLRCPSPDSLDSSPPSPREQSYHAIPDSQQASSHVDAPARAALASTIGGSCQQLRAAYLRCPNCGASLSGTHSTSFCSRLCERMMAAPSVVCEHRDDTSSPDARKVPHSQCTSKSCPLFVPPNVEIEYTTKGPKKQAGLKPKDLIGIPWRVALALQADGWWLRSAAPWVKRAAMPDSAKDRPGSALEYVFLLTKSAHYFFDMEAVKKPGSIESKRLTRGVSDSHKNANGAPGQTPHSVLRPRPNQAATFARTTKDHVIPNQRVAQHREDREETGDTGTRHRRNTDWWFESVDLLIEQTAQALSDLMDMRDNGGMLVGDDGEILGFDVTHGGGFKGKHYATFPKALVEPCILSGTSAMGCCLVCGAPWERVVEKELVLQQDVSQEKGVRGALDQKPMDASNHWDGVPRGSNHTSTTGWRPTCEHSSLRDTPDWEPTGSEWDDTPLVPVPCRVIDPFAGTGTVGESCLEHGRAFTGIDLSSDYIEMAHQRLDGVQIGLGI